ncbi:MAG: DUF3391 domain-containing protein, partial [Nitrospirae bacterium]|nr:DUF3391 domain-containing protein [Nitrospirota bacterium]
MINTIAAKELKVGMYVKIPKPWLRHPFARNEFILTSAGQIKQMLAHGIDVVTVDTDKSVLSIESVENMSHSDKDINPPADWNPEKFLTDDLREAIEDTKMPKEDKANGEEGVRAAKEALPSLIFMGIQLPVMDGLTAM